jgi:hypothetical protein
MVNGQRVVIDAVPCCRLPQGRVIRWADQETADYQAALKLLSRTGRDRAIPSEPMAGRGNQRAAKKEALRQGPERRRGNDHR